MDKSERKRILREMGDKEEKRVALEKTRRIGEDIHFRGIGLLKIQIHYSPSFEKGECWDFRELEGNVKIYKSITNPETGVIEPGYFEVIDSSDFVARLYADLKLLSLPLICNSPNFATLDGNSHTLRVTSGIDNTLILSWGENPPSEWKEVVDVVLGVLGKLREMKFKQVDA